ncbi:PadR family transcriptional regulator [Nocardioides agariphilus]|uniref:PadR family transcriptional regulator n=1 Tax=Nocardioides agariphilus TaxID=433664 RepID=A0A930YGK6_9ACTN|nr:PadR family transcriptional regulator [Nocardioides agariphilus]MBF4767681.1 PadR family transcriptional regulator [Nocardioides agariphilus]
MGHGDFGRQRSRHGEERWGQHRSGWAGQWSGGPWGGWGGPFDGGGRRGRQGPPPWVAELFGLAQGQQQRGPKVRRGDVRAAILDMLREEPMNGYQLISQIAERSGGAWKPSPGSVYPTIQQLEDEGLVEADDERGRRTLRLTDEGRAYVESHPDELAGVWEPFGRQARRFESGDDGPGNEYAALKPEIGQVMAAVWQIVTTGTDSQRREAINMLVETRRKLYGILAQDEDSRVGHDEIDDEYPGADGSER